MSKDAKELEEDVVSKVKGLILDLQDEEVKLNGDVITDIKDKIERDYVEDIKEKKVVKKVNKSFSELKEESVKNKHKKSYIKHSLNKKLMNHEIPIKGFDSKEPLENPEKILNKFSKKQKNKRQQEKNLRNINQRREAKNIERNYLT